MRSSIKLAIGILIIALAVDARGAPEPTTLQGGLKRGVEVKTLEAVMPRGERAVFAEVKVGGEVGFEIDR